MRLQVKLCAGAAVRASSDGCEKRRDAFPLSARVAAPAAAAAETSVRAASANGAKLLTAHHTATRLP